MIRALSIAAVLVASTASAQFPNVSRLARGTTLSPLPQDATPLDYWAGGFMDQTAGCARFTVDGQNWLPCTATVADVAEVQTNLDDATGTLSSAITSVSGVATSAQVTASNAATAAGTAQTTANSAASTASSAQTTANAAQSSANTNATAIAALQATVEAIPRRACANATISGLSIPLLGISSTTTVAITDAPVGTSCTVGIPSFLPLGSKPVAAVLTAGTASLRFEGNSGLLSGVIAIPNGTYRVCCDL